MIVCYRPSHDDQDVSSSVDADGGNVLIILVELLLAPNWEQG